MFGFPFIVSGQLGNNDIHPLFQPTQLAALQHVELVGLAFGNRHLIALGKDGSVYACGDNSLGQLGIGANPDAQTKYLTPQALKSIAAIPMSDVACGDNMTMLLSRDGRLFAFGAGETNQIPAHSEDVFTPVQIQIPFETENNQTKGNTTSVLT